MIARLWVATVCLIAGVGLVAQASRTERVPVRQPFDSFPAHIGRWTDARSEPFEPPIVKVLGVDDYMNRLYTGREVTPLWLYVGYYGTQRQGATMHSPLNCLPGSGWQPVEVTRAALPVQGARNGEPSHVDASHMVVEKGLDRVFILYWYQSRGRTTASEYRAKIFTVLDAIQVQRTDAALVRVVVPIGGGPAAVERARQSAVEFAAAMFPLLDGYLPS